MMASNIHPVTIDSLVAAIRSNRGSPLLWGAALAELGHAQIQRAAELLQGDPGHTAEVAALIGHAAYRRREYALAAAAFNAAAEAGRLAPEDRAAFAHSSATLGRHDEARRILDAVAAARNEGAGADLAWGRALTAYARQSYQEAFDALRPLRDRRAAPPTGLTRDAVEWMIGFLESALGQPQSTSAVVQRALGRRWSASHRSGDAQVALAIFDYKSLEWRRSSRNVGDFIQTVAVLRHIMRLSGPRWTFDDPTLRRPAERLAATWRLDEQRQVANTRIHIAVLDRDDPWPVVRIHADKEIFLLVNGWFLHRSFDVGRAIPFPSNVRPIFVGFHLAVPDHLDDEVAEYLTKHQPIGCRDWSTVYWLLNRGIDAFFSGCLTLTLATSQTAPPHGHLLVDLPPEQAPNEVDEHITHTIAHNLRIGTALDKAIDLLERYSEAAEVTTSRLHAYLPCLALGTPITFKPKFAGDRRFDGLDDLESDSLQTLRERLEALMEILLNMIATRTPWERIIDTWKGLNEDAVAAAKARCDVTSVSAREPFRRSREPAKNESSSEAPHITVVLEFDRKYAPYVVPLLRSVESNTVSDLSYVFLTHGRVESEIQGVVASFPHREFRILPVERVCNGLGVSTQGQLDDFAVGLLALPDMLPNRDRVVYLDIDTIVLGDIAELAATDVSRGIGARREPHPRANNLVKTFESSLRDVPPLQAREFRRFVTGSVELQAPALNGGVLVLALETLRQENFTRRTLDIVRRFGVRASAALNLVADGRFEEIPPAWNAMPASEWIEQANLLHWKGPGKPWLSGRHARFSHLWKAYAGQTALSPQAADGYGRTLISPAMTRKLDKTHLGNAEFWGDLGNYPTTWDSRAAEAARFVASGSSVLDLGCGRMALRSFLPSNCHYIPADLTKWSDEVTAVDLDRGQFPSGVYDYVVALGVFEYLLDPAGVLRRIASHASKLIISFCHKTPRTRIAGRQSRRWRNHYNEEQFALLLVGSGWRIAQGIIHGETAESRQMIYLAGTG